VREIGRKGGTRTPFQVSDLRRTLPSRLLSYPQKYPQTERRCCSTVHRPKSSSRAKWNDSPISGRFVATPHVAAPRLHSRPSTRRVVRTGCCT
jgi:hypothetical protein